MAAPTGITLNTNIDLNDDEIITSGENIMFSKKNTLPYKGLLSNIRKQSGSGSWLTTTGKEAKITDGSDVSKLQLEIGDQSFTIDASTQLLDHIQYKPKNAGEIRGAVYVDGTLYVIIKTLTNLWYLESNKGYSLELSAVPSTENEFFAFFTQGESRLAVATPDGVTLFSGEDFETLDIDISYSKDRPANNGWYDGTNYVIGRDDKDSYFAWAYDGTHDYLYMGCVDRDGTITGEPIPVASITGIDVTYYTPTRLTNGALRWTRLSASESDLFSALNMDDCKLWDNETISDLAASSPSKVYTLPADTVESCATWLFAIRRDKCYALSAEAPDFGTVADGTFTNVTNWVSNDPAATPGIFWQNYKNTEYDNVFPCKYLFTNIQGNRGVTFAYGKGWVRSYFFNSCLANFEATNTSIKIYDVFSGKSYLYTLRTYEDDESQICLDANNNGIGNALTSNAYYATIDGTDSTSEMANSEVFIGCMRRHPLSSSQYKNKAWSQWLWQIGGKNSGDDSLVNTLPFSLDVDSHYAAIYYNGLLVGFSYDKVLVNSPNNELKDCWTIGPDCLAIVTDKVDLYFIGAGIAATFTLKKVADYNFITNAITEYNAFRESRDGNSVELMRAFIPYAQEHEVSTSWHDNSFRAPEDGTAANDVWFSAAAVNANLSDKITAASFILPAIEIPLYVYSGELVSFNLAIITNNNPVLVPNHSRSLFDDEELMSYYTHSLSSTDITYKMSIKGTDEYYNEDYEDNSWWASAQTILFPIGIGSILTGINYLSPTVKLAGNYSARLYTSSNQTFLVYNIANQVYFGSTIFTIYTSSYYYDGEAVYYVGASNNATANDFVCYAIGMEFLANSGTQAYFYCPYDRSIYTFTGSNTLQKWRGVGIFGNIVDSLFSSCNQTLYLLNDSGKLAFIEDGQDRSSGLFELGFSADHLEGCIDGAVAVGASQWALYHPYKGEVEPIELETNWIGDVNTLTRFSFADVVLFYTGNKNIDLKISLQTKSEKNIEDKIYPVQVRAKDWKSDSIRIRVSAREAVGAAFKFKIESPDPLSIMAMAVSFDRASEYAGNVLFVGGVK